LKELAIPSIRQTTNYTCGPASLLSVLRYLRVAGKASERSLATEMGCTSECGTEPEAMLAAALKRWPNVDWTVGLDHAALVAHVAAGDVCILDMQAWTEFAPLPREPGPLVDGHYAVVTCATPEVAVFMDPASRGRRKLSKRELRYRWVESHVDGGGYYGGALIFGAHPETRWRYLKRWKIMANFNKFDCFVEDLAEKKHNLGSDQIAVALCAAANAPVAANTVLANLTQISYTNLSSRNVTTVSSSQTSGLYKLILQDLTLTASGTVAGFRYIVLYNDTATNDELIGWYDYTSDLVLLNGETLLIDFDASAGVLQIQ
jgi:hypothetical protein